MRMSRAAAYAVGSVLQLAEAPQGVPVPCSRLAKVGEMPERFLLQVLRNLVNHGVLHSTRGVEGGYSLSRPLDEITLLHIFEATDGPLVPSIPPLDSLPQESKAKLERLLGKVTTELCQSLSGVSMADLLSAKESSPAHSSGT